MRDMERADVEAIASGRTSGSGRLDVSALGSARAELVRRDQEYAEHQERARQEFERELEKTRAERENSRQQFDAALSRENRKAAEEAAKLQAAATREASERQVRISDRAAWAAVASAIAAIASLIVTVLHTFR